MDANRGDESGEMYLPNEHGEYMPMDGAPEFSVQGLSDALSGLGFEDTVVEICRYLKTIDEIDKEGNTLQLDSRVPEVI